MSWEQRLPIAGRQMIWGAQHGWVKGAARATMSVPQSGSGWGKDWGAICCQWETAGCFSRFSMIKLSSVKRKLDLRLRAFSILNGLSRFIKHLSFILFLEIPWVPSSLTEFRSPGVSELWRDLFHRTGGLAEVPWCHCERGSGGNGYGSTFSSNNNWEQ